MKEYTVMPNYIAKILNSADTYRYVALTFSPLKNGYTNSTFKQIAEYIDPINPEPESTVRSFANRLKKAIHKNGEPLLLINENIRDENGNRRNHYYIPQVNENFRMIKDEFRYLPLDIKLKGFILQLFSITINNTLQVKFSIAKISKEVNVSRPAATKYMKELIELGFVKEIEGGYELDGRYFKMGKTPQEKEIEEIKKIADTSIYLKEAFDKIDWSKISAPKKYWEAAVIMRLRDGDLDKPIIGITI